MGGNKLEIPGKVEVLPKGVENFQKLHENETFFPEIGGIFQIFS